MARTQFISLPIFTRCEKRSLITL